MSHTHSRRLLRRSFLCSISVLAFAGGGEAATAKATASRRVTTRKPAVSTAKRPVPVAAKTVTLKLVRPQFGPAAVPTAWRVCPGIEESALVQIPPAAPAGSAASVTWTSSPPLAGCRVTGVMVPGPTGSRHLLVQLRAPAGARPGRYNGVLTVRFAGAAAAGQARLAAEVLPFELMRPSKQYAVSRVPVSAAECCAPDVADTASLRQLREIGIGCLSLDTPPQDRAGLEQTMRAAGLRGPVLAPISIAPETGGDGATESRTDEASFSAPSPRPLPSPAYNIRWYTVVDSIPTAADAVAALKAGGAMIACRLDETAAPEAAAGGVDLPIFDAGGTHAARLAGRSGPLGATTTGWWRWDAGDAAPLDNRLRSGARLWKSGLSGALVEMGPDAAAAQTWALQWDGVRQGILDSRYMTTLFAVMRQVKDMDRSNRLPGQAETAVMAALKKLTDQPSPAAADQFRDTMVTWILRLRRVAAS